MSAIELYDKRYDAFKKLVLIILFLLLISLVLMPERWDTVLGSAPSPDDITTGAGAETIDSNPVASPTEENSVAESTPDAGVGSVDTSKVAPSDAEQVKPASPESESTPPLPVVAPPSDFRAVFVRGLPDSNVIYVVGEHEIVGEANPGAHILLEINGEGVDNIQADEDGKWTLLANITEPGEQRVHILMGDQTGKFIYAGSEVSFATIAVDATCEGVESTILGIRRSASYVVAPCETLAQIAELFRLSEEALIELNPELADQEGVVIAGQILNIE